MSNQTEMSEIRSALLMGYKKHDVEAYIEKLQHMIMDLKDQNDQLEAEEKANKERMEKAQLNYTALWEKSKELEATIARQEEAIAQYQESLKQCAELIRDLKLYEHELLMKLKK